MPETKMLRLLAAKELADFVADCVIHPDRTISINQAQDTVDGIAAYTIQALEEQRPIAPPPPAA